AGVDVELLQHSGPAVAAIEELLVGETQRAVNDRFVMRVDAPGAPGELERRQWNFHDSLPTRIFLYALLRPAVGDGRFCRRRRFAEAEQIREQLIRSFGALRQLPPEVQADIQPFALAVVGLNERAGLDAAVVRKLILELHEILVA